MVPKLFPANVFPDIKSLSVFICICTTKQQSHLVYPPPKASIKIHMPLLWLGVAQWTEGRPVNQRVSGSIPSQGTCLACGPGLQ